MRIVLLSLVVLFLSCSKTGEKSQLDPTPEILKDDQWNRVLSIADSRQINSKIKLQEITKQSSTSSSKLAKIILNHWSNEDRTFVVDTPAFVVDRVTPVFRQFPPGNYTLKMLITKRGECLSPELEYASNEVGHLAEEIRDAVKISLFCPAHNANGYFEAVLRYSTRIEVDSK